MGEGAQPHVWSCLVKLTHYPIKDTGFPTSRPKDICFQPSRNKCGCHQQEFPFGVMSSSLARRAVGSGRHLHFVFSVSETAVCVRACLRGCVHVFQLSKQIPNAQQQKKCPLFF